MSKITQVINRQAYEYIRDRILEILVDELDNQAIISYDADLEVNVFLEIANPLDKTELSAIVISLASGKYDNKHQGSVDGLYQFHIDCFTNAKTTAADAGDTISTVRLHKILGVCRSILEDPIYKTLGFVPPFIMKTFVGEINIATPNKEDASNTSMGRLLFNVVANETSKLIIPNLIEGYDTTVKIDNTGKGYFYQGENYP